MFDFLCSSSKVLATEKQTIFINNKLNAKVNNISSKMSSIERKVHLKEQHFTTKTQEKDYSKTLLTCFKLFLILNQWITK